MVMVERLRQAQKMLQKPMQIGGGEEIKPAHDVGNALHGVIHDH